MSQEIKHKENDTRGMFYLEDDKGITSELTYKKQSNGVLVIDHTQTRPELEGNGLPEVEALQAGGNPECAIGHDRRIPGAAVEAGETKVAIGSVIVGDRRLAVRPEPRRELQRVQIVVLAAG